MDDHEPNMLKNFIFYLLKLNNHIYLQFNHLLNCSSECTQIEAYIVSFLPHAKNCVKICGLFQHEYQLFERGALSQIFLRNLKYKWERLNILLSTLRRLRRNWGGKVTVPVYVYINHQTFQTPFKLIILRVTKRWTEKESRPKPCIQ